MEQIEIKIIVAKPVPAHQLALEIVCKYFEEDKSEFLTDSKSKEHSRRKSLLYFLLNNECSMTDSEIADICGTTRQNISYHLSKMEVTHHFYLHNVCDYNNIKGLFLDLLERQKT